jgi:hypothetical protein
MMALRRFALAVTLSAAAAPGLGVARPRASAAAAPDAASGHWVAAWYSPPLPRAPVWGCNQIRTFSEALLPGSGEAHRVLALAGR